MTLLGFEFTSAKSKRPDLQPDLPVQERMAADKDVRRKPSTDQKKTRRRVNRKTAAEYVMECYSCGATGGNEKFGFGRDRQCPECGSYEVHGKTAVRSDPDDFYERFSNRSQSMNRHAEAESLPDSEGDEQNPDVLDWDQQMSTGDSQDLGEIPSVTSRQREAQILQAMSRAVSLDEQHRLAGELESLRRQRRLAQANDHALDLTASIIRDTLTPVRVHERVTASTDWLDEVSTHEGNHDHEMRAEATLWYGRVHEAVKADRDELREQALGMAQRLAGRYGEQAEAASQAFLDHVSRLRRQSAPDGGPNEQSGHGESTVTDYDTDEGGEKFDEDFWPDGEEETGSEVGAGQHPPMSGAGDQSPPRESTRKVAAEDYCRLCNEPMPGPYNGHATPAEDDNPYKHEAEPGGQKTSTRKTAVALTNITKTDDPLIFKGKNPSGEQVRFRVSEKEANDLRAVMTSDLAINFSGVTVDEGDIVSEAQRKTARTFTQIATDIEREWGNVNFAARPYLDALKYMATDDPNAMYGADKVSHIAMYFLSNASSFRGEKAKALKKELKDLLQGKKTSANSPSWPNANSVSEAWGDPFEQGVADALDGRPQKSNQSPEYEEGYNEGVQQLRAHEGHKYAALAAIVRRRAALGDEDETKPEPSAQAQQTGNHTGDGGVPERVEVGNPNDRPAWPVELEGDPDSGDDAANVAGTHTPGQSVADYPDPTKTSARDVPIPAQGRTSDFQARVQAGLKALAESETEER